MCNKLLDSMTCNEHQAELYCKQCRCRKYGPKGIGFGIGADMCNKLLESTNVAPHEDKLFCKQCHGRNFGPKGVGFGLGAGCLTTDSGERFGGQKQTNRPMTSEAFCAPINPSHS
ncbi:hypothetical protein WR25_08975 [Diploscapter pachys]|uniref:LIM zinc-binding domain-containing protein n=1 Tax=Diploscapter pachys TaxID=2018661 RepID=A0A2A2K8H8_9BILA|nr:hypothetical protein WR25_08975 [Diploscapter pachys]